MLVTDEQIMRIALRLARRGRGRTSPNPMVGAVLVKRGRIVGRGWHRQAGRPHAEIEAIRDAGQRGQDPRGGTLFITLEPCSSHGRTPPCTEAIRHAGIRRVVIGAKDPNPKHLGRAFRILRRAGVEVETGVLGRECVALNEAFNHWIVHGTPFVTVKAAMSLDGKIATRTGESKWITGKQARAHAMRFRRASDAILVGVNTILADDPALTVRTPNSESSRQKATGLRRIVLDSMARTPLTARVVSDEHAPLTTIVVSHRAPKKRVAALARRVTVLVAPPAKSRTKNHKSKLPLPWLLRRLGREGVLHLLVEGGGEVNASFLLNRLAQRVAFFYAPKILGGRDARKAVAGEGMGRLEDVLQLEELHWRRLGSDLLLSARVVS